MSDMDIDRHLRCKIADLTEECKTLRSERDVLVRLLLEADKVLSTVDDGESQDEWDRMADLRRSIMAATLPHRPEEADLLSLRACIGA